MYDRDQVVNIERFDEVRLATVARGIRHGGVKQARVRRGDDDWYPSRGSAERERLQQLPPGSQPNFQVNEHQVRA